MITALLATLLFAAEGPPLPWEPLLTPALATGTNAVIPKAIAVLNGTNAPAAPSRLSAAPEKTLEVRWVYPADFTNVSFWVYRTTNLVSWQPKSRFDYNIRVAVFPMIEAREFFTVCASNDAGQICIPRIAR